jgi:hypothetical protein
MIRPARIFVALASLTLLYTLPAIAQPEQAGPWYFTVDGGGVHQSEADLKDSTGGFSKDRWFVGAGVTYAWSQRDSIGVSVGGGRSTYDFNDEFGFGSGDPWSNIEDSRVSLSGRFCFGETGSVFIIPTLRYSNEKGASSGDSSTWGIFAAMTWRLNEDLTIGPGIGVFSRLESGTKAFPILAIDWNINERWNLSTGRGLAASVGPGLSLNYKINDDWSLGLSGRYEDVEFRLNDEGAAPGGVGRDQSIPLILAAGLTPNKKLSLSVFAGLEFAGKLKLKDSAGVVLEESKYDPALLVGATFEFRF